MASETYKYHWMVILWSTLIAILYGAWVGANVEVVTTREYFVCAAIDIAAIRFLIRRPLGWLTDYMALLLIGSIVLQAFIAAEHLAGAAVIHSIYAQVGYIIMALQLLLLVTYGYFARANSRWLVFYLDTSNSF